MPRPLHVPTGPGKPKMWQTSQPSEKGVFFDLRFVLFGVSLGGGRRGPFHDVVVEMILRRRKERSPRCPHDFLEEGPGPLDQRLTA